MNGIHDLGGVHGLGPIDPEPEATEPLFHADWERRVLAVTLACGALGQWNIDMGRHARERQHPVAYLTNSYYQTWLHGLGVLLVERGVLSAEELATGRAAGPAPESLTSRKLTAQAVGPSLARGTPYTRDDGPPARFRVGDAVRVVNRHPLGHTRAPRYVRGRVGTIRADHGLHVFADASAHGASEARHLYSVTFTARELWGPDAPPRDEVHADLWDPHLEPAP